MTKKWFLASGLAALSLTTVCCVGEEPSTPACEGAACSNEGDAGNPSRDDFDVEKVEVAPLIQNTSAEVIVTLNRSGFQGPVNVTVLGLPANVSAAPLVVGAGESVAKITLVAASTAPQGTTEITINASDLEGKRKHEKKGVLLVRGPAGSLDTTFGQGGKVTISTQVDSLQGLTIQPDGKALVALNSENDFVAYRIDANGVPDATFGNTARAVADLRDNGGATTDTTTGMGLSPDGTIFVSGYTTQPSSKYALARFTTAGKQDALFDGDGYLFSAYGPKPEALGNVLAWGVSVQPDGKPVLAAQIMLPPENHNQLVLIRFKQNGAADPEFSNGGFPTAHSPDVTADEGCRAVAIAGDDGKVLCAGSSNLAGVGSRLLVWRVDNKGVSDPSFDGDGIVVIPNATIPNARAHAVHALPQGRVLVTGSTSTDGGVTYRGVVVKLSATGVLDGTFAAGSGVLFFDWGMGPLPGSPHSSIDANGRAVVVAATGPENAIGIARIDPNGQLDEAFAPGGKQIRPLDEKGQTNVFVAHQSDGRIVVASTMGPDMAKKVVLLRLWN